MKKKLHVNLTFSHIPLKNSIWILFSLIFCIEFVVFKYSILKEISPYYPTGFDQSIFLVIAYTLYDNIKQHGFFASLSSSPFLSTGALFPYQAVLFFYIFGLNRFSALLPNILYFISLQIITLIAFRHFTKKHYLSILMLGWMLTIQSPIQILGGLFDFRMDFIAFCLYGIFIACVMKSELFLIKKWSVITGLCALLIILMRTITLTYMIGVVSIMTFYFLYQTKKTLISTVKNNYTIRLRHSAILLFFIFMTSFIFLYLNKNFLYHYYVIGHVINNEKYVRVIEAGIKNSYELLGYYPAILFSKQIGAFTWVIMLIVLCLYLFSNRINSHWGKIKNYVMPACFKLASNQIPLDASLKHAGMTQIDVTQFLISRQRPNKPSNPMMLNRRDWCEHFLFFIVSFLTPLIILTFDTSKSSIVGSIAVMPFLWFVMWIILLLDKKKIISKTGFVLLNIIAVSTLFIGLNNQIHNPLHQQSFNQKGRLTINQMYQDIGNYAINHNWLTIDISTDRIVDYLIPTDIQVFYYENHKKLLTVHSTLLGGSMFPASPIAIFHALKKSHVVIFNISNNYPSNSPYPADLHIALLKPRLIQYTEQLFNHLGDYKINESMYRVYVK